MVLRPHPVTVEAGERGVSLSYRAAPPSPTPAPPASPRTSVTKQAGTGVGDWIFIYVFAGTASMACTGFTVQTRLATGSAGCWPGRRTAPKGPRSASPGWRATGPATMIVTVAGGAATLDPAHHRHPHVRRGGARRSPSRRHPREQHRLAAVVRREPERLLRRRGWRSPRRPGSPARAPTGPSPATHDHAGRQRVDRLRGDRHEDRHVHLAPRSTPVSWSGSPRPPGRRTAPPPP